MIYGNRNRFEFNEMKLKGVTTRKMCVFGVFLDRVFPHLAEYGDMLRIQYVNYVQSLIILEKVPS